MDKFKDPIGQLRALRKGGDVINVIIETPRGSRNKYKHDPTTGLFKLGGVLPAGHSFPYDFGFIPGTIGGDRDPLDVLVLMDEPGFVGLWVESRLIGGWKAYQTEKDGEKQRNDRLVAVSKESLIYKAVKTLDDLDSTLVEQFVHFFISYNEAKGKKFKTTKQFDAADAVELVRRFTTS